MAQPGGTNPQLPAESMALAGGQVLILGSDALMFADGHLMSRPPGSSRKGWRFCGLGSSAPEHGFRPIPYYNILWAHVAQGPSRIVIEHAEETRKNVLAVKKEQFELPSDVLVEAADEVKRWVDILLSRAYGNATRRKRAWVLVNPHAGRGGADRIWTREVEPLLAAARMPMTVVRTSKPGEAVALAEALDVHLFDMAILCSGDGLPHEVFNGLARRHDARHALAKLAVCPIPCGSGNGMSCNLYGTHHPGPATLAMIKGVPTRLDLASITQGDERYISFLSQTVGITAELDIMTENLRWMGHHRFTYGFLKLALQRKVWPCDIACKVEVEKKEDIKEHYRNWVQEGGPNDDAASSDDGAGLPPLRFGTVKDKLPEGWELIAYDELGTFYCGNMAYMAPGQSVFPATLPDDGCMDLVTIKGNISFTENVQLQLSIGPGQFFDSPLVNYRKITAYRLIPHDKDGVMAVDGERFPFAPMQAEVHRGLGLTLSKNGGFEAPGPLGWDKASTVRGLTD